MPTIEELLQEHSISIVRGQLKKIVEIYDLEWIVVHELVQNAIDAIQANPEVTEGEVDLILDLDNDIVTVKDNGTGFTYDPKLLCPAGTGVEKSLSSRSPTKGYQGVGLKAVMYSTILFEIESETKDKHWTFSAENLADYIDSEEGNAPEYDLKEADPKIGNTYTTVKAHFRSGTLCEFLSRLKRFLTEDSVKWKELYLGEKDSINKYLKHFFSWYFRTQSYVGCVNRLLNIPVKNALTKEFEEVKPVKVRLHLKSETQFSELENEEPISDWLKSLGKKEFIAEIPNRAWDYYEIITENHEKALRYRVPLDVETRKPTDPNWEQLKPTFRNRLLDLKLTPNNAEEDFHKRYADFIPLLERQYSRTKAKDFEDVLEKITGIYLAIGRTAYFEQLGMSNCGIRAIASNGIPTDHILNVTSTSSTWYLETIHMIINVDATLNLGKRHLVNKHLVGRIQKFFTACYPTLVTISKLFVARDADPPDRDPLPAVIGLGKLRRKNIPFHRFPSDENTLIGLFSASIGLLNESFSVFSYFGKALYDGKFRWVTDEPGSENDLSKLEFKVLLTELINEFERSAHDKEFADVSLIIVWDRRISNVRWQVKAISQARQNNLEQSGVPTTIVEYVLENHHGRYCPLICVADLLQKIDLVNGETDDLDAFVEELG